MEQIRHKLISFFEGKAKASRVKAVEVDKVHFNGTAETACRNVAFKLMFYFKKVNLLRNRLKRFLTLTSKVWPATLRCIFLIRMISGIGLGLFWLRLGLRSGICCAKSLPQTLLARNIRYHYKYIIIIII